ncbi:conserved protein of unknown function [Tenacibaculum sp. 190524A02b]|uniref:hypothetical protein n=1 Tax=Tenacibaculum vairaonense TaxID=3137860 RepID=UPI0032B1BBAC
MTEQIIVSLVLGIISSIIASIVFIKFFLGSKRPKIEISKYISKVEKDGNTLYYFKFVNKTKSEIYDVNIECTFHKPVGDFGGKNLRSTDVKLSDHFCAYVASSNPSDDNNLHAIRIKTEEDILSKWDDSSSFIRLTIIAKHSLSGFNKVFTEDFNSKDCITDKKFQSGDNLDVK